MSTQIENNFNKKQTSYNKKISYALTNKKFKKLNFSEPKLTEKSYFLYIKSKYVYFLPTILLTGNKLYYSWQHVKANSKPHKKTNKNICFLKE